METSKQPNMEVVLNALTNPRALERGLLLIAGRQTLDERMDFTTKYDNKVGFEAWAAQKGTRIANYVADGGQLVRRPEWLAFTKKVLTRNKWQLLEEAWKKWWAKNSSLLKAGTRINLKYGFTLRDGTRLRANKPLTFIGFNTRDNLMIICDSKGNRHEEPATNIFRRTDTVDPV